MKACHEGNCVSKEYRVPAGHFGRDKTGAVVVARWYFPHIFKCVTYII